MSCYCPLHAPQLGCPGWQGLSPSAWNTLAQVHQARPRMGGLRQKPSLQKWYPALPRSSMAMPEEARKALWGLLTPDRGGREPPAQCQHSSGSGLPARPAQNNTLVVAHGSGQGCNRPCLALRMALIVSWGPLGARPTQARRVLRRRAAGPWMLVGRRLEEPQPSDGYSGLPLSSAGCLRKPWMCSGYLQTLTLAVEGVGCYWWLGVMGGKTQLVGSQ